MPTGYTSKLMDKGQSFKEFAMDCARAFGACITLRDAPSGTKIPEKFEPSDYNTKELAIAKEDAAKFKKMSQAERTNYGKKEKARILAERKKWLNNYKLQNSRLSDMRGKVEQWIPPSFDHKRMKEFMLQQLGISFHDLSYTERDIAEGEAKTPEEYFAEAVKEAKRGVEYHQKELLEEKDRVDGRNEWVRLLRESLKRDGEEEK